MVNSIAEEMLFVSDTSVVDTEVLQRLNEYALNPDTRYAVARIGDKEGEVDTEIRNTQDHVLMNEQGCDTEVLNMCFQIVNQTLVYYLNRFPVFNISHVSSYRFLKYGIGGKYLAHSDKSATNSRVLTFIMGLNDDYEGGEVGFPELEKKIKIPAGGVVVFPSTDYYTHEVHPVTSGERRTLVTWYKR